MEQHPRSIFALAARAPARRAAAATCLLAALAFSACAAAPAAASGSGAAESGSSAVSGSCGASVSQAAPAGSSASAPDEVAGATVEAAEDPSYIGADEALAIAKSSTCTDSSGAYSIANVLKNNGKSVYYDIRFYTPNSKYVFCIDAMTGNILYSHGSYG